MSLFIAMETFKSLPLAEIRQIINYFQVWMLNGVTPGKKGRFFLVFHAEMACIGAFFCVIRVTTSSIRNPDSEQIRVIF